VAMIDRSPVISSLGAAEPLRPLQHRTPEDRKVRKDKRITRMKSQSTHSADACAVAADLSMDDELKAYRDMLLIRRFEERAGQMYGRGLIAGFCHLYIGQEAVAVGMQGAIEQGDQVITAYRDHGHMLAAGISPRAVMAELTGRQGGISRGKGGSMHMFSPENGFYGGHGIVGAQVSVGTGIAFANRYRGSDRICLAYFGDGAANQGQIYESFNMAKLWSLPVVYVIENNHYGMGTSIERASATLDLSQRGQSFNVPGEQVNAMDVSAVRRAGIRAVDHARKGDGPYILEMLTYRYRGHSMSDPAKYRSRDEVQKIKADRDPIDRTCVRLREVWNVGERDLRSIDAEVRAVVLDAAEYAEASQEPDVSELYTDVCC